jgi:hypothetical protein
MVGWRPSEGEKMKNLALPLMLLGGALLTGCPDKKPEPATPAASAEPTTTQNPSTMDKAGAADKPATDKPAADKPATDKPATDKSGAPSKEDEGGW